MQHVSCDEVWYNGVIKSSSTDFVIMCGLRSTDNSHMHVLFSQGLKSIDDFAGDHKLLEMALPGGVYILGIGVVRGQKVAHASLQICLRNMPQQCIVMDFTATSSKLSLRMMEGGLLKPFNGLIQVCTIPIENHVTTIPVNLRLPVGGLSKIELQGWFRDSVQFIPQSKMENSDIFVQRALVRLTDYRRPPVQSKQMKGIVKLVGVSFPDSDSSSALCESFVRRLTSDDPESERLIYVGRDLCSCDPLFALSKHEMSTLSIGLRLWENELNVIRRQSVQVNINYMHLVIILIGVLVTIYFYRY